MNKSINKEKTYKEFFKKKKINCVILDMDNTLVNTDPYYSNYMNKVGETIARNVNKFLKKSMDEKVIQERVNQLVFDAYYTNNKKPILIAKQYQIGVKDFLKEVGLSKKEKEILKSVKTSFSSFYKECPNVYPSTLRILDVINSIEGVNLVIYSHAQKNWTRIKVDMIKKLYEEKYSKSINLPYVTTPIEESKDAEGWKRAAKSVKTDLSHCLVVGDNWNADILSAVYAGCKNLIWIRNGKSITKERRDEIDFIKRKAKANVYVANSIAGVKNILLTNNK